MNKYNIGLTDYFVQIKLTSIWKQHIECNILIVLTGIINKYVLHIDLFTPNQPLNYYKFLSRHCNYIGGGGGGINRN